ncbi:MAG: hypothetical protein VX966_10395, partial [Chloroflexota bacterium]|nr:hypothetical protein [Chloroflexota bacterium]
GTLRDFGTYYNEPGIKQIEIMACSAEGGCTSDIAIITILDSGELKLDVLKPIFTFACGGIGGTHEAAVNERVSCGLGRAVEGQGPGEVATITWSAPGGLPSSGTLRAFETYYNEPGIKQIEIMACSSEGGCTSDIAIITILGTK